MTINVEPSSSHPLPYSTEDDEVSSFADALTVTANTQALIEQLGGPPEMTPEEAKEAAATLQSALKTQNKSALNTAPVAFAAREFIRVYSARLAADISDVRTSITNKLLELANCGDPRYELKALELLGKHSDIALFTERSEVTINYKTSSDLEEAIKERVKRLLNSDIVDVTPITSESLDEELGIAGEDTDTEELVAQVTSTDVVDTSLSGQQASGTQ
jgi:hypothetical protein